MTEKKSSESRRKLLKTITAGTGAIVAGKSLPESWSRPVVDSVMLPAHAQTSCTSGTFSQTITLSHDFNDGNLVFNFDVSGWCPPSSNVDGTATSTLLADLSVANPTEFIEVEVDGTPLGRIFETVSGVCPTVSGPEDITIPYASLASAAADGIISLTLIPGPGVGADCGGTDDQTVTLVYQAG